MSSSRKAVVATLVVLLLAGASAPGTHASPQTPDPPRWLLLMFSWLAAVNTPALLQVLQEFRQRYVISYTPQGVSRDGWHTLKVRVKSRGAAVRARPGYLAGPTS